MQQYDSEGIAAQWDNLVNGRKVNSAFIRPEIYASWCDCRSKAIDPHCAMSRSADVPDLLERSKELISAAQPFMSMINEVVTGSGLRIDCIDHEGYFLCACGDQKLLQESEYNGFVSGCNVAIDHIGTNAAGLCIALQRPVQVLGPEHYNVNLHNLNCSATPVFDADGRLAGVLNILSYATPQNPQTLGLTASLAKAIENQLALSRSVNSLKLSNLELNAIIEYLPQGVIALNRAGKVERYNRKALELLSISAKLSVAQRHRLLHRVIGELPPNVRHGKGREREYTLLIGGSKRSYMITAQSIEKGERTLIMIEDSGRIQSLSAAQSNKTSFTFDDIKGECVDIIKARDLAGMVAATDSSVLLIGESGTGKELFAQAIHSASERSHKPFVAINCGAIPADIIESELFGYEPGAFTGARSAGKPGRLEMADGGTLFLDEIEAMPLSFQVKLLRAFSARSMVRVGGVAEIPLNIRIIAAAKVDLLGEVTHGRFREDLYYRIATFPITIPPLHRRGKDIALLTGHFLEQLSHEYGRSLIRADESFYKMLAIWPWRGNIRELRNVIERAVVVGLDEQVLTPLHLPEALHSAWLSGSLKDNVQVSMQRGDAHQSLLQIAEEAVINMVLKEENGNISRAARRLGIARSTLYKKLDSARLF